MINRRDFIKGVMAAAVVTKTGFYIIADKIVKPAYAEPILVADGAVASGMQNIRNGWYRVWASWDNNLTQSLFVKSIYKRDTNTYPIPIIEFKKPPVTDKYLTLFDIRAVVKHRYSKSPWGVQLESGPMANQYITTCNMVVGA